MAPHGLGQRRLEARLDMLGVDEAHRQPAGQGIQKGLHRLRPAQRGCQQPDLMCRFSGTQRGIGQHCRQRQSLRTLPFALQHVQPWPDGTRRIAHQALELAEQAALPAWVELRMAFRRMPFAEQDPRGVALQQGIHERGVFGQGQIHQPQVRFGAIQIGRFKARRVIVQHHLIATSGQRLLQHVTLQRGIGEYRNTGGEHLRHRRGPGAGWPRAGRTPGTACPGTR